MNWHFTLDGLQAASDRIVRLMDRICRTCCAACRIASTPTEREAFLDAVAHGSAAAWWHFNLQSAR
jgi:hypothetical protein